MIGNPGDNVFWSARLQRVAAVSVFVIGALGALPAKGGPDEGAAGRPRAPIHQDIQAKILTAADRAEFDRFFFVYSNFLVDQLNEAESHTWEFWVVLAEDIRHHGKVQLLVSVRMPRIKVTMSRLPLRRSSSRALDVARTSLALVRNPFFAQLARGDESALEIFQPGQFGR